MTLEQLEPRVLFAARWAYTATDGVTGPAGTGMEVTWSVVPDGTMTTAAYGEPFVGSTFRAAAQTALGPGWLDVLRQAFRSWTAVCGVRFTYESHDDGATGIYNDGRLGVRGDIRIGGHPVDGAFQMLAYTYYPPNGEVTVDTNDLMPGGFYYKNPARMISVLAHEVGHAIGMEHSTDTKALMYPVTLGFQGPQPSDIAAVLPIYGPAAKPGDANLDGKVNIDDYVAIDSGIHIGAHGWRNGDFNGDGVINVDDYVVIDSNVGR